MAAKPRAPGSDEARSRWMKPVELAASTAAERAVISFAQPVLRVAFRAGHGSGSTRQQVDGLVTDMFACALAPSH